MCRKKNLKSHWNQAQISESALDLVGIGFRSCWNRARMKREIILILIVVCDGCKLICVEQDGVVRGCQQYA